MKKVKYLFAVLVFITTACATQTGLEDKSNTEIRKKYPELASLGVTAEEEALKYLDRFPSAVDNPSKLILVKERKSFSKLKLAFKAIKRVEKHFIVYDKVDNRVYFFIKTEMREETSYIIILFLVSILLFLRAVNYINNWDDGNGFFLLAVAMALPLTVLITLSTIFFNSILLTIFTGLVLFGIVIFISMIFFAIISIYFEMRYYSLISILFYILVMGLIVWEFFI